MVKRGSEEFRGEEEKRGCKFEENVQEGQVRVEKQQHQKNNREKLVTGLLQVKAGGVCKVGQIAVRGTKSSLSFQRVKEERCLWEEREERKMNI